MQYKLCVRHIHSLRGTWLLNDAKSSTHTVEKEGRVDAELVVKILKRSNLTSARELNFSITYMCTYRQMLIVSARQKKRSNMFGACHANERARNVFFFLDSTQQWVNEWMRKSIQKKSTKNDCNSSYLGLKIHKTLSYSFCSSVLAKK